MNQLKNIERLFNVINRSVFMTTGTLDYDRVTDATIRLANEVHEYFNGPNAPKFEGFEVWNIGEYDECTLADYIVGAYWLYADWHSGQWSKEYAALSALSRVFDPGMTSLESEEETPGYDAYCALEEIAH